MTRSKNELLSPIRSPHVRQQKRWRMSTPIDVYCDTRRSGGRSITAAGGMATGPSLLHTTDL